MPGEGNMKVVESNDGAGVTRFGKAYLYARACALVLVLSMAALSYCAAYVYAAGISLLNPRAITVSFFVALALAFVSALGTIVFAVRQRSLEKYDLSMILPSGAFDKGGMLSTRGEYVKDSVVKAEVTVNEYGRGSCPTFSDVFHATLPIVTAVGVVVSAATFGLLYAKSKTGYVGVVNALAAPGSNVVAQVCLVAAAATFLMLAVATAVQAVFRERSQMVVLDNDTGRVSDKDAAMVAEKMNVSSSDMVHVRLYKVTEPPRAIAASALH